MTLCATLLQLGSGAGCGYSLQNSKNPLLEKEGILSVYVAPVRNDTFKPGVENVVYNQLIRVISSHRRVVLKSRAEEADAVLSGRVISAVASPTGSTTADKIFPSDRLPQLKGSSDISVATEYSANLNCQFTLNRVQARPGKSPTLWSAGFSRSKTFPSANGLDVFGTTTALTNESEFDRALSDLAEGMMGDLHESMLAMF